MKITEKLTQAHSGANPPPATFSFEFFVPKTSQGVQNLYDRMDRMYDLNPIFVDITWNAGGRSSSLTNEMVYTAQSTLGLETCMHLTCTNMAVSYIDEALEKAFKAGCQNILALRGDPPLDGSESTGDFRYAKDLIAYIRKNYGDHFNIGIAAYPEGHPEENDNGKLLQYLKEKTDAGADFIITQMFYDVDNFIGWCRKIRDYGINIPIIPGIMPISTYSAFIRRANWSQVAVPQHFLDALDPIKEDDFAVRELGSQLVADLCQKLIDSGFVNHLHFYTMNLEKSTIMLLEKLNLVECVKEIDAVGEDLPWRKSLHPNRSKEAIRPIFWQNRKYSYISRTSGWDEFPNGRWGDSRSPAFGDIDLSASELLRQSPKRALELWGCPQELKDLANIVIRYLNNEVKALPWSDGPIGTDTNVLKESLIKLNENGFITLNSQTALNSVRSNDKVHGWGPKNGFVYQKQYLEFMVHKDVASRLVTAVETHNQADPTGLISFYMVDKEGNLTTNAHDDDINAVTWGVFPGEEILQPTIVEKVSFLAWKDEVFSLIKEWDTIFHSKVIGELVEAEKIDAFSRFLTGFGNNYVLCNMVNNDFTSDNSHMFQLLHGLTEAAN
ncbi:methylenetetrahydrofolate reduct [Metschnikowia bicuspidata var. bicuspidata NRRL YB-4993]|uniref:Methylenetetrahydrofolate reduct n=1 Tax=Metschnikowia bicuspidata var. bicuspidata NRRL YB-4993 TaxID=869754 RepID=A0A1A0HD02_9ASCO|nr:methylenetetrahydrofolate reduct [Metschnikowia bicuspidata var. bicuspidata NRRL YB-4993]OBA21855.1 methylenetetrahydrofolate reduct [Metschnikowia bicuspidata var. bicuspidata NRRL YB-4993]